MVGQQQGPGPLSDLAERTRHGPVPLFNASACAATQGSTVSWSQVDVERAELEVLAGLQGDEEWGFVRQVVMEVHDLPMQQQEGEEGPEQGCTSGGAGRQDQQAGDKAGEQDDVGIVGRPGGRLRHVVGLLRRRGFSRVVVQQEAELRGTTIYNVYAVRG